MKVDGLKFTDALKVERCPEIPHDVDVQMISIGIEEAGQRTRSGRPDIPSRSNPRVASCTVDQFFGHRSNRIGNQQNDSNEESSVQIHPKDRESGQSQENTGSLVPLCPVQCPAKRRGKERGDKMWPC